MSEESNAEESLISSPFSRRSLLKAGAIVGGTVWVAPVIDSFVSRAAAASLPPFPCSYANIIFTLGTTQYVIKLNNPNVGCNLLNTDGSFSSETFSPCNSVTYGVDSNNVLSTVSGSLFSEIPAGPPGACSHFTINGRTVSWDGAVTVQFVLIHDGSFGKGTCAGTLTNGTTICAPSGSFTVPSGCC
jgi:hypothetical protein